MDNNKIKSVFLCSPTNSQMFTTCCEAAICNDEVRCPNCNSLVVGHDEPNEHERGKKRWRIAFHKKPF